jgi:ATP-dependent DNA helicase PIF1
MDPISLLALAALGGFIWKGLNSRKPSEPAAPIGAARPPAVDNSNRGRKAEFDVSEIEVLDEYRVVKELVDDNFPLIFVTGSAGTGKSTFIRWMQHIYSGKVLVAAPTGMAAINVEGQTIHRLCSLPPAFILKGDVKKTGREEIKYAKVLIIDEVSMVTSNLLDAIAYYFKINRDGERPFGGVPVVVVGDLFQLPPVVTRETKPLFEKHYGSPKFFEARCLEGMTYYAVDLKKTYRQSDQFFVDLLTQIRIGRDLESVPQRFNEACRVTPHPPEGAVHLSPRNREVEQINQAKLAELASPESMYHGKLTGQFKRERLPAPRELVLREGAQVMFTKNGRRSGWVNGTVGVVKKLRTDEVDVLLDSGRLVTVTAEAWNEFDYHWNAETREIEREIVGSYTQLPLMLGWAITIHKSQGKTIEKVHVDLGAGAFETGQTYVALSRCRALEGLTMSRPLTRADVMVDQESRQFHDGLLQLMEATPPAKMLEHIATARTKGTQPAVDFMPSASPTTLVRL